MNTKHQNKFNYAGIAALITAIATSMALVMNAKNNSTIEQVNMVVQKESYKEIADKLEKFSGSISSDIKDMIDSQHKLELRIVRLEEGMKNLRGSSYRNRSSKPDFSLEAPAAPPTNAPVKKSKVKSTKIDLIGYDIIQSNAIKQVASAP